MKTLESLTQPFADLKILALQADDAACGHYRIAYPLEMLKRGGAQVTVSTGFGMHLLAGVDIVIAQRQYHPQIFQALQEARLMGKTLIYEIDDNVHHVMPNSVAFNVYRPGGETCRGVQKFIQGSDALFTSSPELASQYGAWNPRTWVLPNCIDIGIRDWDSPVPRDPRLAGKVVIGWLGSITHQDDWAPLQGVLPEILARFPNAVFAIASAHRTMDAFCQGLALTLDQVVRLDPTDFQHYPALPAQIDIGLAPVVNTTFNRAKSELKPLEYGARHAPYVASTIAPYVRLHQESGGQGGYLAGNRQEWIDAISTLVADAAERDARGQFMYDFVRTERSAANNAWRWAEAIRAARDARFFAPETTRRYAINEKPGRNSPCPCGCGKKAKQCQYAGAWG